MHHPFETLSLHSAAPPLSLRDGGAEALFEGWEDHPGLRGSRPGQGNARRPFAVRQQTQDYGGLSNLTQRGGDTFTYEFSGNV